MPPQAAEGYAKSTGETGVILTTSGPGLTNIITPLQALGYTHYTASSD